MKAFISILIITLFFIPGCVSMPKPIDDAYLVDKTPEQKASLEKLEESIIAKKKEKDKAEKELAIAEQKVVVHQKRIASLNKDRELLLQEEKLYKLDNNQEKLAEIGNKLKENAAQMNRENLQLQYSTAFRDSAAAILDVKKAEFSVLIAQLNYDKAKIADAYLARKKKEQPVEKDEKEKGFLDEMKDKLKKSDEESVNVKEYAAYLNKQQDILKEKEQKGRETAEKLAAAEKKLREAEGGVK